MPRRYFNWKLAIVLVIGLGVLSTTAVGLRRWHRDRRGEQGLQAGIEAYNQREWEQAAMNLGRYLAVEQSDVPILLKYADAQLNIRPLKSNHLQQAIAAYRTVLRIDKANCEAATKLVEIYLAMGMPGEAELIASRQISAASDPGRNGLELRRLLALALAEQRKFNEAATQLKAILQEYPEQVTVYETLGQLAEQRPQDYPESAIHWFDQAITNNPFSALAYISRAGFHLRSEAKEKALADLQQAEKLDLSDPAIRLRLAAEFINANVPDKAEQHLEAVQQTIPTDQSLWQTWAQLALKSLSKEKMLKVAETGLHELSWQPWEFMPTAAELFIRAGSLDRATECITKLKQQNIFPETTAFLQGLVADQKGQQFEAVKSWRRSIELGNKSAQVRLALASALWCLGDTQSAQQQLRTLISERPNSIEGHLALARLLAQADRWEEAAEHTAKAVQLSPENLDAGLMHLQAQIQSLATDSTIQGTNDNQSRQDIKKRLATLEEATNGAFEVKLLQFQLAMRQNNFTEADALLTKLKKDSAKPSSEADPSQIKIAIAEADLLFAQSKEDEAILVLSKAIKEFPEAAEPVKYLEVLLARQGNHQEAEAIIKDALAHIEQPATQRDLGLLLAQTYTMQGKHNDAYDLLTTVARQLPNDIPIKRRLLECTQVAQNPAQAQKLVDEIKFLEGQDGWQWRYEQARIWFAADDFKNRYPQIIPLLQKNLLTNPDDQASRTLLATAYERAGEMQLAISTYREALARSPDDLRIIIPAVAALYKAKEYDQADEILSRASEKMLYHPELAKLRLQSYLRRGQLSPAADILQDLLSNDPNNQAARLSLALVQMHQHKYDIAEELLTELKAQDPDSIPVAYAQVRLNLHQDKQKDALKVCDEIIDRLNNASSYILRAKTYIMLGQADKAVEDLGHATVTEPDNLEVWIARSQFYRSIGRPDLATADIQQALSLAPNNVKTQKHAISLFLASGNPDQVRHGTIILDEALKTNPNDTELRLLKTQSLLAQGTAPAVEMAEQHLQKIIQDQPDKREAWVLLGEIFLRQKQPGKAIDAALRGLTHVPNDKTLLQLKARAEATRAPVLAIPTLKALRDMDPSDVDVALQLAEKYVVVSEPEKAVKLLQEQLTLCKDVNQQRKVDIALAAALYRNGSQTEAQKKFDSLLQSMPGDPSLLLAQTRILKDDQLWSQLSQKVAKWYQNYPQDTDTLVRIAKDLAVTENDQAKETAEDLLHRIIDNDPNNLPALNTLAMLLQMMGRSAESVEFYQQVLKRAPDNVIAINNLAWIMCEEQGEYQQALQLTQKGLMIASQYIDLIDTRGVVYYRLGELDKAVKDFDTCIKLYPSVTPSGVTSRFHLARAFAKLGQTNKAVEHLNKALDIESRIGGLSTKDLTEAHHLLEQLQGGS